MTGDRTTALEGITLLLLCLVVAVAALAVFIWAVVGGRIHTLDGLVLAAICLIFTLAFGGNVAWSFRTGEAQSILKGLSKSSTDKSNDKPA